MNHADRISSIFWLSLSLWVMTVSHRYGLGDYHNPGAGFIFFWSALFLASLSILLFLLSFTREAKEKSHSLPFGELNLKPALLVVISMFVYTLALEKIGFLLSTFVFITFLLSAIGSKKWYFVLLVAVVASIASYLVFEVWLQAQLPKGFMNF